MAFDVRRAQNDWRHDPVDSAWTLVVRNRRLVSSLVTERAADERAFLSTVTCPYCERVDPILDREGFVVAIPSPSPLAMVENPPPPMGPFLTDGALGAHEIIVVEGSDMHGVPLEKLSEKTFADVCVLFSRRHADLGRDPRLQSVTMSMLPRTDSRTDHRIAHILATPFPAAKPRHPDECALCDDAKEARVHGRVIVDDGGVTAWVPFAPASTLHARVAATHGTTVERIPPNEDRVRHWAKTIFDVVQAMAKASTGACIGVTVDRLPLRPQQDGPPHLMASIQNFADPDLALGRALGHRIAASPPEATAVALRRLVDEQRRLAR